MDTSIGRSGVFRLDQFDQFMIPATPSNDFVLENVFKELGSCCGQKLEFRPKCVKVILGPTEFGRPGEFSQLGFYQIAFLLASCRCIGTFFSTVFFSTLRSFLAFWSDFFSKLLVLLRVAFCIGCLIVMLARVEPHAKCHTVVGDTFFSYGIFPVIATRVGRFSLRLNFFQNF
jgi:hypothetical protein